MKNMLDKILNFKYFTTTNLLGAIAGTSIVTVLYELFTINFKYFNMEKIVNAYNLFFLCVALFAFFKILEDKEKIKDKISKYVFYGVLVLPVILIVNAVNSLINTFGLFGYKLFTGLYIISVIFGLLCTIVSYIMTIITGVGSLKVKDVEEIPLFKWLIDYSLIIVGVATIGRILYYVCYVAIANGSFLTAFFNLVNITCFTALYVYFMKVREEQPKVQEVKTETVVAENTENN